MSTIAAIATGPAAGGVGIIRLSGPVALSAARRVAVALPPAPTPRHAYFTPLVDADGARLDEGLAIYFPGPRSFTGEDVVELHAHGAPRLLSLLLELLLQADGVRLASAGEFTRRAFVNGRVDLAKAEAVADLVSAESEAQVRAAAAQMAGEFSARLKAITSPLLELRADVEGALDFPDEAEGAEVGVKNRLSEVGQLIRELQAAARRGALVRRGARVVLYGPVNAGKSTLFNSLVGSARALVDAEPGTTRDTLEARLELGGLAVTLVDTAGLRADAGRIEALGIERTRAALSGADLALLVIPPEASADERMAWARECTDAQRIELLGKIDVAPSERADGASLGVSGATGQGLAELRELLIRRLGGGDAEAVWATSQRHLDALARAAQAVSDAELAADVAPLEVVAGEVGIALEALAELTGQDASTALLDKIFERFCIGK